MYCGCRERDPDMRDYKLQEVFRVTRRYGEAAYERKAVENTVGGPGRPGSCS